MLHAAPFCALHGLAVLLLPVLCAVHGRLHVPCFELAMFCSVALRGALALPPLRCIAVLRGYLDLERHCAPQI